MSIGVVSSLVAVGLAVLLARETRLRRSLESLCARLLHRLRRHARSHRFRSGRH